MMQNQYHVINDPVHGTMQFSAREDSWIKPFIDSPSFQRLRHIKQLGLADWIFPGAVHSRFSHGLGCCYIVNQICNKLHIEDEDKQLLIIAGLMHDVGHGPFSHMFEEVFHERAIRHERWTARFLREYDNPEFLEKYNQRNADFPLNSEKLRAIQELIMHTFRGNKLLSDIISSQLDADRLDYLLRDSHFCGVTYGSYEFRWLLHCLTVIEKDGKQRLGITRKGVGVVEEYLMARRLMMRNVYHHGKKIGAEFFMQQFLKALSQAIHEENDFLHLDHSALIQFLKKMNAFNRHQAKAASTDKSAAFIEENFHLYSQLCDYDVLSLIRELASHESEHDVILLAKRLHNRILPKVIPVHHTAVERAKRLIADYNANKSMADWQLALLSLPHQSYSILEDPILIAESTGAVKSLHTESLMIGALSDKSESHHLISFDQALLKTKAGKLLYNALRDL